jgi:hypothetical protein
MDLNDRMDFRDLYGIFSQLKTKHDRAVPSLRRLHSESTVLHTWIYYFVWKQPSHLHCGDHIQSCDTLPSWWVR